MRPEDLPEADREFIALSRKTAQQRRLRAQALVGGLVALVGLLGVGLVYREPIRQFALGQYHWRTAMGPAPGPPANCRRKTLFCASTP